MASAASLVQQARADATALRVSIASTILTARSLPY
jgi:hypothetical protein